ncbi:hypothetical protein DFH11DRAFT_431213 [Phellopilus nigrolimitatus]|nr:hypothetical protein DFH11DRAFT_431213 [Phellopilus nigrolimitatus]
MIAYSSVHHSPREPSLSEWKACDKPLGLWACFWIAKLMLDCCMTYWGWTRDWKVQQSGQHGGQEGDTEQGLPGLEGISSQEQFDPTTLTSVNNNRRRRQATAPFSRLYSRLSLLLSLIIVSWFLTSNILVFTSLHTCRFAAPHLWWLIFSILCLQYLIILEVFVIAMLVFIIGPLIYLFWNIVLICLGRHPMQNPHYINPEIGKLSKSLVDQIPLVLYIPSPPEGEKKGAGVSDADIITKPEPVYTPGSAEHTYPPKPSAPKRRFTFLSRKSSKHLSGLEDAAALDRDEKSGGGDTEERIWEDCWEHGEFPFVRLEENRASCAICLLDFEEPKRRVARDVIRSWAQNNNKSAVPENDAPVDAERPSSNTPSSSGPSRRPSDVQEVPATDVNDSEEHSLRLEDAGEGAQPLRLLECGHVFHKTCVDPWLTRRLWSVPDVPAPRYPPSRAKEETRPNALLVYAPCLSDS